MTVYKTLFKKIALNKPIVSIVIIILLFELNYIFFDGVRTYISAQDGTKELSRITDSDISILNLDPKASLSSEKLSEDSLNEVYNFLTDNWKIGLNTSGFISDLENKKNIDVPYEYVNEDAATIRPFEISSGQNLTYDYDFGTDPIPVLVGWGLKDEYPIGKVFEMEDHLIEKTLSYKVVGVLQKNESRSNYYVLDSKRFVNYTVVVPVNADFIAHSGESFKRNSLMDLMIFGASKDDAEEISRFIFEKTGIVFNVFSQTQNNSDYYDSSQATARFMLTLMIVIVLIILLLLIWSLMTGLDLAVKDITINLLVGLRLSTLRSFFYLYYGGLYLLALGLVFLVNTITRYIVWITKDSSSLAFGFLASPSVDWLSYAPVLVLGIVFVVMMVEIAMFRVRRLPLSIGVLK